MIDQIQNESLHGTNEAVWNFKYSFIIWPSDNWSTEYERHFNLFVLPFLLSFTFKEQQSSSLVQGIVNVESISVMFDNILNDGWEFKILCLETNRSNIENTSYIMVRTIHHKLIRNLMVHYLMENEMSIWRANLRRLVICSPELWSIHGNWIWQHIIWKVKLKD